MDTISLAETARRLGTSIPRVKRAATKLGIADPGHRGRLNITGSEFQEVRRRLGVRNPDTEFSPAQLAVMAALERSPLGMRSRRSLARKAGLSPTAASRAVSRLHDVGLVDERPERVAMGRARTVNVIRGSLCDRRWPRGLGAVTPPERHSRPLDSDSVVPLRLRHLFWNTATEQLDASLHGSYVARRLLQSGDLDGLAWGANHISPFDWERASHGRGLPLEDRALARNLARSRP